MQQGFDRLPFHLIKDDKFSVKVLQDTMQHCRGRSLVRGNAAGRGEDTQGTRKAGLIGATEHIAWLLPRMTRRTVPFKPNPPLLELDRGRLNPELKQLIAAK